MVAATSLTRLRIFTSHPGSAPHTHGRRVVGTGCCKNADVARSPCRTSCCTVPMTTTASSLHFYGNRHMGKGKKKKLFHKASQTGVIIQQRSQCYSFSNGKWEGKELFGLIIRLVVILETDMQAHSELILTERHSFNLPKCFVPG